MNISQKQVKSPCTNTSTLKIFVTIKETKYFVYSLHMSYTFGMALAEAGAGEKEIVGDRKTILIHGNAQKCYSW